MCKIEGKPQNWSAFGPAPPLAVGAYIADSRNPPTRYSAEFDRSTSNDTNVIKDRDPAEKMTPLCPAFKGHWGSSEPSWFTDRSATHDFLLTFHTNCRPISYRFRDELQFQSKIANFPTPVYLAPLLDGFPLKLGIDTWGRKTTMMRLPGRERSLTISSAVLIQCTNVTDGRTADGLTDTGRQQWPRLRTHSSSCSRLLYSPNNRQ